MFRVTFDLDFGGVIRGCSEAERAGNPTWITPEFITAYEALHRAGFAHSVEVWSGDTLAGGLYGVAIGRFFAGESMFHRKSDASKVAVVAMAGRLQRDGFGLFDTQMVTPVTQSLGATEVPREEYLERLAKVVAERDAWGSSGA